MRLIKTLIAASLLLSSTAFAADGAATLSNQQGTVLVNQGEEFITATEAQVLKAGDRVLVMEGGSAEVIFNDGCVLPLASGSMAVVSDLSTCAGSVAAVEQIGPSHAQAIGAPRQDLCDDQDISNDAGCDRCDDDDDNNNEGCPVAYWTANNRGAGWVFGTWTAGIAYALIENNYSIRPVSP